MHFLKHLSEHPRGGHVSPTQPVTTPSEFLGRVTIGELSDNLLLNIFRYYLDVSPQHWPRLVHICRRWRRILFASQQTLHLRIFCTHGTPVSKTLHRWPAMPIVVQYGGTLELGTPAPKDEDNIMAALKQPGRVSSINLTITSPLLEKLVSSIKTPFLELEDLVLLSRGSVPLTLPSAFRWGQRLRRLHSTRIAFPTLIQLLASSRNLVDLQLHEVFDSWHFSPEALTSALSGMAQLQSLSFHFLSAAYFPAGPAPPPPSGERVVLPVLTRLNFRGVSQYLEGLVDRIDAPILGDIEVTFINKIIIDLSKLSGFINRIEMHKSHYRADILSSDRAVSISLIQPGAPVRLKLHLFCEPLSEQLFSIARICTLFSSFLLNVEDLFIGATRPPRWNNRLYNGQWLEPINSFTGVKRFHIAGNLSTNIVRDLQLADRRHETVLPTLHKLYIPQPEQRLAPLGEAIVSFMVSRWLSGHPIGVEYERLRHVSELRETVSFSQQVVFEMLSDGVLLNIFRYYLDVSPKHWPRLVHICRRWRRILFASQQTLHLRIFCTHGTPVSKTLHRWPAMPIVVQYGGSLALDPPTPEDEDNIMAVLKQSHCVGALSLTITKSLLEKLSTIETQFSELEDLVLLSRDSVPLTLPSAFRWGQRLRRLHSTRIAFPALLQLLASSRNLVDLQLHEVFDSWHFSPEALTNALSGMAQLQSLSLHFPSAAYFPAPPPPSGERVVLPVLTHLNVQGISGYLEGIVAKIDAPRLGDIELTFLNEITTPISNLREFVDRIEIHKLHRRADILSSDRSVSISLTQPGALVRLKLHLFCEPLSEQLFSMARLCTHFSAFLLNVEDLRIGATRPSGWGGSGYSGWRDLLNSFTGVKWFHLYSDHSTNILRGLQLSDKRHETTLPSLHKLYIPQPGPGKQRVPLGKAVVSFMISRQLSGNHIAVEYERLCHINELCGTGSLSQQVTIELLSDDVLLGIFRRCLDLTPKFWPTLSCVCERWRQTVFGSPLGLSLRLYCTYGKPVLKTLDFWPSLPLVVNYGGSPMLDPPALEDNDNIMAALRQSDRVASINLTVTPPLLESLSTISKAFSELEELVLLSGDNVQLTLSSTFRWGPRLRTLHSTRIGFPSLPQLLSPSHDLVDIQLHEIPSAGYFSPEGFANALSGMTNLRTLSLHFLSLPPRRNYLGLHPLSGERIVLPALTCLKYRGTSKYLDGLVARIDSPDLADIEITFFSQPTMDASQLGRFIERTEMQTSLIQATIQTSGHAISISFTSSGNSTPLRLQIPCKQLDWQLSSMAQVCVQFSPFLFGVNNLRIKAPQSSGGQDDVDSEQWLELVRAFGSVTDFQVADKLSTGILCALGRVGGGHATVLPSLRLLHIENPLEMDEPSWGGLLSFIALRSLSGHPVQVNVPSYQCHICHAGFRLQQGLESHVKKHTYRIVCSYCDFECTVGHNGLFRTHLAKNHPDVALDDALSSDPPSTSPLPLQLDGFVNRHSSLRAPDIVALHHGHGAPPIASVV